MSLTDLQRDILIKAAEGIQEGMWCRDNAFTDGESEISSPRGIFLGSITVEEARTAQRCATGELALRTVMLGGDFLDYLSTDGAVLDLLVDSCDRCPDGCSSVEDHNDHHMDSLDQFSAGQEWARIFREVAS